MKQRGEGGRVFYGALVIGTVGAWEIKPTPGTWLLDADGVFARYWCDARPQGLRVELTKQVAERVTTRGTEDPPKRTTTTTVYGRLVRLRPDNLMLKDLTDEPPEPATEHHNAG